MPPGLGHVGPGQAGLKARTVFRQGVEKALHQRHGLVPLQFVLGVQGGQDAFEAAPPADRVGCRRLFPGHSVRPSLRRNRLCGGVIPVSGGRERADHGVHLLHPQGFGQVAVHAYVHAALFVLQQGMGRHGHDGRERPLDLFAQGADEDAAVQVRGRGPSLLAGADDLRGRETVHDRHLQIHEDEIVGLAAEHGQGVESVAGVVHGLTHAPQQEFGQLTVGAYVVDQEDFKGPKAGQLLPGRFVRRELQAQAEDPGQGLQQLVLHEGLGQHRLHASLADAHGAVADLGQDDGRLAVEGPAGVHELHAGEVAEVRVEDEEVEAVAIKPQAVHAFRRFAGQPPEFEQEADLAADEAVVGHDQDLGRDVENSGVGRVGRGDEAHARRELEGAAVSGSTLHVDVAAHEPHELAGDGQAQARAAVDAGGGAVDLGEVLEDGR
ncbi:hypothetical protein DSECCO2_505370 [anaerobic digester metagenome]